MDKNYGNIILSEASSEVNTIINDNNFDRFLLTHQYLITQKNYPLM